MNKKEKLMEKINEVKINGLTGSIFKAAFLYESPTGINPMYVFNELKYNINELIDLNVYPIINLNNNLKKIELETYIYYWIESSDKEIQIATEVNKVELGNIIRLVGKNSKYKGLNPFANIFYEEILKDVKGNLIFSDDVMTEAGYNIWKKLFLDGHKISVYDATSPGKIFIRLKDLEEFDLYFKMKDERFRKYRFVITEQKSLNNYGDLITTFGLRRIKELMGVEY
jgi:hypothetical protein